MTDKYSRIEKVAGSTWYVLHCISNPRVHFEKTFAELSDEVNELQALRIGRYDFIERVHQAGMKRKAELTNLSESKTDEEDYPECVLDQQATTPQRRVSRPTGNIE